MEEIKKKRYAIFFNDEYFNIFFFNANIVIYHKKENKICDFILPSFIFLTLLPKNLGLDIVFNSLKKKNIKIINLFKSLFFYNLKGNLYNYLKILIINGIGFKFKIEENIIFTFVGYQKPIKNKIPNGIQAILENNNKITLISKNKFALGKFSALIKSIKPIEKYKGKGIRFEIEKIILKKYKKQ